jgi:hypothetical protein
MWLTDKKIFNIFNPLNHGAMKKLVALTVLVLMVFSFFTAQAQYYTESDSSGNTSYQMNYYFNQGTIFPVEMFRTLSVFGQDSLGVYGYFFEDSLPPLQITNPDGSFVINGLSQGTQYQLGITTKNSNAEAGVTYNFSTTGVAGVSAVPTAPKPKCFVYGKVLKMTGCSSLAGSGASVRIFNILGQQELIQKITTDNQTVDIASFAPGVHLVSLGEGSRAVTQKVVIE